MFLIFLFFRSFLFWSFHFWSFYLFDLFILEIFVFDLFILDLFIFFFRSFHFILFFLRFLFFDLLDRLADRHTPPPSRPIVVLGVARRSSLVWEGEGGRGRETYLMTPQSKLQILKFWRQYRCVYVCDCWLTNNTNRYSMQYYEEVKYS